MADQKFQVGDPVWSKMKGYCPWPSRIASPSETNLKFSVSDKKSANKPHHLVYFYGSNNFAWMPEDAIKPFEEFKEKNKNGSKSAQFKTGLKRVEDYILSGGKATLPIADSTTGSTMKNNNNDSAASPEATSDSPSNDASKDLDDSRHSKTSRKLSMSIEEELQLINTVSPASVPTKSKTSNDSHNNDSSPLTSPVPSNVQRDYSRTPFKSRKSKADDSTTELTSPTKRTKTSVEDRYDPPALSSSTLSPAVFTTKQAPKSNLRNIMMRPQLNESALIESPRISLHSATAKSKAIRPSSLKFGFIGLGFMGQRLLKNLLDSKHKVIIWNRSAEKCEAFCEAGAESASTPADVVAVADVVFGCLPDVTAIKEIMFGSFGILSEMGENKSYVEMGSTDPETSKDVFEAILQKGGQYLEAPSMLSGRKAAEDGELVIVSAGDKKLYEVCHSCFQAMAKKTFYLGSDVGAASKMKLVIAILYGAFYGALSESCALLDRFSIDSSEFTEILKLLPINSPLLEISSEKMIKREFSVNIPSEHLQKDLRKALIASDEHLQSLPITAVVNEIFKKSMKSGYNQSDAASLFLQAQY